MRTPMKHAPWLEFALCAAAAVLAAVLYLATPQKPPELSDAEWRLERAHTLWKGYLILGLICASISWFVGGCWRYFKLTLKRGKDHNEA